MKRKTVSLITIFFTNVLLADSLLNIQSPSSVMEVASLSLAREGTSSINLCIGRSSTEEAAFAFHCIQISISQT